MTTTSIETNKANIQRVFEELWSRGDLAVANQLYAADYIRHDPATPDAGTGINPSNRWPTPTAQPFPICTSPSGTYLRTEIK